MPYVIAEPCVDVKDKACVDECPVDCIYEGDRTLYINPNECVDCGACEPACPVEAIFYEDDLPEGWEWYRDAAVDYFDKLGDLGGATDAGASGWDEERVAALPPRADKAGNQLFAKLLFNVGASLQSNVSCIVAIFFTNGI